MKLSTIFKLIFAVVALAVIIWIIIGEIQFQQMKNEVQKVSLPSRVIGQHGNTAMSKRYASVILAILFGVTSITQLYVPKVSADKYDNQIQSLQREIDRYQSEAGKLKDQAKTLEREVAQLDSERQIIESQINLSQLKHDQLQTEIENNKQKLSDTRDALGSVIADIYIDSDITSLEMIASSKSIGDYVDKSSYQSTVTNELRKASDTIKSLKKSLEEQQTEVKRLLAEQELAKNELVMKATERQSILDKTQGEASAYNALVSDREKKQGELHKQQQAEIEAAMRRASGGIGPITIGDPTKGGYPWEAGCWVDANAWSYGGVNGNGTDPLGYGCRQCVSYTAFKVGQRTGNYPRYWGNANMWPSSARAAGYQTGNTPRSNSVGIIMAGQYGHTVWVDSVNSDGTLTVSQYNYYNAGGPGWGNYSKMRVSAATYNVYIYF